MRLVWFVCVLVASMGVAGAAEAKKPNIIYMLTDDLGYGDLSCYGQKKFTTPHIDRLATEGMTFTQHYSGSTVCAPSRCSLMTGLHTGHTQVRGNREIKPEGQASMAPDTLTLPRMLKKAGYTSGMFGKWGLGAPGSVSDPIKHFDRFYGYNCQRQSHTFYPKHLWSDDKKVALDGKTYSFDLIMDQAVAFIKENKEKPFFCYMSITIPHAAMHAPKDLHDKWREKYPQFENVIGLYSHNTKVKNPIAAFPAMMEALDNRVGEVLDLLKELGIDDNTIVMFTSDNGPHEEGGHDPRFWGSSGPLTGTKRSLTEGGIRVPFLVRWPSTVEAGSRSDHQSAFWDMMPTFAELAGLDIPEETDGISIVPTLTGKEQKTHPYLYWEFHERGGKQALRQGDWKLIRRNVGRQNNPPYLLYNLKDDLTEKKNLAGEYPEKVEALAKLMSSAREPNPTFLLLKGEKQAQRAKNKK